MGSWAWEISARFYRRTYGPLAHALDAQVFSRLGDLRGRVVADVGCGPGVVTRKFLEAGAARVFAIDASPSMLAQVADDPRVVRVRAHLEDDPLPVLAEVAGGFDVVLFKRSLYQEREAAVETLRAARRGLRPGGVVCVVHPEASLRTYAFGRPNRVRAHTPYHLFNRAISTLGVLVGGEQYVVYTRWELLEIARAAADGARVDLLAGDASAAFNVVLLHAEAAA